MLDGRSFALSFCFLHFGFILSFWITLPLQVQGTSRGLGKLKIDVLFTVQVQFRSFKWIRGRSKPQCRR